MDTRAGDQPVIISDEARRMIDETTADMRELHRGTLALMHELHAEKMQAFDRLEERISGERTRSTVPRRPKR